MSAVLRLMTMLHTLVIRLGYREVIPDVVLLLSVVLAWYKPQFCGGFFDAIERAGARLAERKGAAILLLAAATILIRLCLLLVLPVPVPQVHDEFSYLLAADTFAHGRLTNPPHPMWVFFDTMHVNQLPTYMSKYPPAQGAVLALGQLLGSPWLGVVLSVAVMCAVVLWMMQGWLPPRWALLGGVLVLFRFGIFSYWINSYWGGAVAAIGGGLVVGAMPRIMRFHRTRDALLLALGALILGNSRPLEGFILLGTVMVVLAAWFFSEKSPPRHLLLLRVILPICALGFLGAMCIGYYNWRGTGHPTLLPYSVNESTYLSTPSLAWEKLRAPIHYSNPEFDAFYNGWARKAWLEGRVDSVPSAARHVFSYMSKVAYFFVWPELLIPLIALPWFFGDKRIRFLMIQTVICFAGILLVPWSQAHYAAPLTATLFVLLTQAFRHLRQIRFSGRPAGIGLSRVAVLAALFFAPFHPHVEPLGHPAPEGIEYRAIFEKKLKEIPGEHLAIVRYYPERDADGKYINYRLSDWVYNSADIDHSKVIWAREIPNMNLQPLLDYFGGRQVWLVEPDAVPPRITPYTPPPSK
jgi:hypothetical protein